MTNRAKIVVMLAMSLIIFMVSLLFGYMIYYFAYAPPKSTQIHEISIPSIPAPDNVIEDVPLDDKEPEAAPEAYPAGAGLIPESYFVMLVDGKVNVYLKYGELKEFLYVMDIEVSELPDIDRQSLMQGIEITTKEELAHFEEDFTS